MAEKQGTFPRERRRCGERGEVVARVDRSHKRDGPPVFCTRSRGDRQKTPRERGVRPLENHRANGSNGALAGKNRAFEFSNFLLVFTQRLRAERERCRRGPRARFRRGRDPHRPRTIRQWSEHEKEDICVLRHKKKTTRYSMHRETSLTPTLHATSALFTRTRQRNRAVHGARENPRSWPPLPPPPPPPPPLIPGAGGCKDKEAKKAADYMAWWG